MPQLFDPLTFTQEQANLLTNVPGQSLADTNSLLGVQAAQSLTPSPNIPIAQITPQTPFKTQATAQDITNYNAILAGTSGSLPAPVDPEKDKVDKNQQDILDVMGQLEGEEAFAQAKGDELGLTKSKKDLADLTAQLTALNNEAIASTLEVDRVGRPAVLTAQANIEKANIERDRTIKALRLSSSIQAIQGNIALAETQVQRAVDLKYKPLEKKLETLNKTLEFNYKSLTASEKKQADKLKAENDLKLEELEVKKSNEKAWESIKNTALSNGAPLNVTRQADQLKATGQEDAARALLAPYTGRKETGDGSTFKGFTGDETVNIKNDLAEFGLDKVLTNITDPKQVSAITALAKNVETTVSKLTRTSVASLFGMPDNDEKSGFLGLFGRGKTNRAKLDELLASIKQYQDVGYSDDEILKLMK